MITSLSKIRLCKIEKKNLKLHWVPNRYVAAVYIDPLERRMAIYRTSKVIGILALLFAAVLILPSISESFAVDRCLDAGGSFNYTIGVCDHAFNHPYIGIWERHGTSYLAAATCAVVAFGLLIFGSQCAFYEQ